MSYNSMPYMPVDMGGDKFAVDMVRLGIVEGLLKSSTSSKAYSSGRPGAAYAVDAVDYLAMVKESLQRFKDNSPVKKLDDIKGLVPYNYTNVPLASTDRKFETPKYSIASANNYASGCGYRC